MAISLPATAGSATTEQDTQAKSGTNAYKDGGRTQSLQTVPEKEIVDLCDSGDERSHAIALPGTAATSTTVSTKVEVEARERCETTIKQEAASDVIEIVDHRKDPGIPPMILPSGRDGSSEEEKIRLQLAAAEQA